MKIKTLLFILGIFIAACNGTDKKGESETKDSSKSTQTTIHLTKAEFLSKITNYEKTPGVFDYLGDKPALIDFYATWCGPCKVIAPILEELAKEYDDEIYIYKIDVDAEKELAEAFGIQSIPSLLFIPMDKQPQMIVGGMSKAQLKETINDILLKK